MAKRRPGRLLLIGGGDRRDREHRVLRHFVAEAGGADAKILVLSAAAGESRETLDGYSQLFRRLGAASVWTDPVDERAAAEKDKLDERVDESTAVFFTGGDQLRLTTMLAATRVGERIRERHDAGGYFVAGTSAGAVALGSVMIIGGPDDGTVRRSDVTLGAGLGLLRDCVIATHFNERGRGSRLLTIFAQNSQVLGIGIDTDTALDVHLGSKYMVVGNGVVTVFDGRVSFTNASRVGEHQPLAISGVALHVLPEGYGFDPKAMTVITPSEEFGMARSEAAEQRPRRPTSKTEAA